MDVTHFQDLIADADKVASLPGDYVLDTFGKKYHPKRDEEEDFVVLCPKI